jgi:acetyl-CoA synthetase
MSEQEQVDVGEAQIAVHWQEEEYFYPSTQFIAQANMTDPDVFERFSLENFPECYKEYADLLTWDQYWHTTLDTSDAPSWKWFVGGKINACFNCVDRHLPQYKNKAAIIYIPEPEDEVHQVITYQELWVRVNELAALLQDFAGLKAGDRVTLHMPMVPELPVTMLACARLGVIHSEVYGGFSGKACGERIADSGSRVLITIDGYYRNGHLLDHKEKADEAVELAEAKGETVDKVLVWRRYPDKYVSETPMVEGRDYFIDEVLKDYDSKRVDAVPVPAEDPHMAYVVGTSKYVQDIHPEDVYWCMADIGWITGHSYIVYGPLALAATSVMYEGVPTYPDAGRAWRIAERLNVNIFHTAPTTIRMLRKAGPDEPKKYNFQFKHMTTVGEPIEPEVWRWYHKEVGKGEAAIVDTWWQTETGGFLCSTLPALAPMKPGSAGPAVPGIHPIIYDEDGDEVEAGSGKAGNICIRNPWPGAFQTIWGDRDRFVSTYYAKYNKDKDSKDWRDWPYFTGDAAVEAEDGYYRILGRVDDVINVAGHRLGTKELESACLVVTEVAEAAVVPLADELKGKVPDIYVSLKPGYEPSREIQDKVVETIETTIGKIARPKHVYIVADMPKTRSGKIMRRVLAAISNGSDIGDVTTLANSEIVDQILEMVQGS